MALRLVTADERIKELQDKTSVLIFGPSGVGKTTQIMTLPDPEKVLVIDMEAGLKSVADWRGTSIQVRTWLELAEIACLAIGPDRTAQPHDLLSEAHCAAVRQNYSTVIDLRPFRQIFMDSITEGSRLLAGWARTRPESYTDKGVFNSFGYYGLIAREMIRFLKHFQRAPGIDTVFVGILEKQVDDIGRISFRPQLEGAKTAREIYGIVDNVVTMEFFDYEEGAGWTHAHGTGKHRAFVCTSPNPWALPSKDRSGRLDMIEEPNLGKLLAKINRPGQLSADRLSMSRPDQSPFMEKSR